ncbi:MAG: HepT-like ribonuclease domain-containing protein [Planctomycetota bacterium]
MPHEADDASRLWDMLEAARKIQQFVAGKTLEAYSCDDMLQAAVERKLEIIGEAARNVSPEFQRGHPEIPWRGMISQRHFVAHEYGEIVQEKLWRVATVHVIELVTLLEPLIPPLPPAISE